MRSYHQADMCRMAQKIGQETHRPTRVGRLDALRREYAMRRIAYRAAAAIHRPTGAALAAFLVMCSVWSLWL